MTSFNGLYFSMLLSGSLVMTVIGYTLLGDLVLPKVSRVERQVRQLRTWWYASSRFRLPQLHDHLLLIFEYDENRVRKFYLRTLFLLIGTTTTAWAARIDILFSIVYIACFSLAPYIWGLQGLVKRRYFNQRDFRECVRVFSSRYLAGGDPKVALIHTEKLLSDPLKSAVRRLNNALATGRRTVVQQDIQRFVQEVGGSDVQTFGDLLYESLHTPDLAEGFGDLYEQMAATAAVEQENASDQWEFRLYVYLIPFLFLVLNAMILLVTRGQTLDLYLYHPVIAPMTAFTFLGCVGISILTMFYFIRGR